MSSPPTERRERSAAADLRIRLAEPADTPAVAHAVRDLLEELGGAPDRVGVERAAAAALLSDAHATTVLLADDRGSIAGLLGVSWPLAIRALGRYALIQELWVHPQHRDHGVGSMLLIRLMALARDRGVSRIEVGLPGASFEQLARTEGFYRANGFKSLGTRMRRSLA